MDHFPTCWANYEKINAELKSTTTGKIHYQTRLEEEWIIRFFVDFLNLHVSRDTGISEADTSHMQMDCYHTLPPQSPPV